MLSSSVTKQGEVFDTKENNPKELASRQNSVQYSSLLSEIHSKREGIHNRSLKHNSGTSKHDSPTKELPGPEVIYSNTEETTYMNTAEMYNGRAGSSQDQNAADIVFQLDKIIRDNQSNGAVSVIRDSTQSAQSVETEDDEAHLIRSN
jgi:hypothetical protein